MADKVLGKKLKKKVNPSQEVALTNGLDVKRKSNNKKGKLNDLVDLLPVDKKLNYDANFGI